MKPFSSLDQCLTTLPQNCLEVGSLEKCGAFHGNEAVLPLSFWNILLFKKRYLLFRKWKHIVTKIQSPIFKIYFQWKVNSYVPG